MYAVYREGRSDARQKLDQVLLSVGNKCQLLENAEVTAVRSVMLEEHTRFCFFVECLQPLMVRCTYSVIHNNFFSTVTHACI